MDESLFKMEGGYMVSPLHVMKSAAGYYLGRTYIDEECGRAQFPYDRQSKYFAREDLAAIALESLKIDADE